MRLIISYLFAFTLATAVSSFAAGEMPLPSPAKANKNAAMHNAEGIKAYKGGDYAGAAAHFMEAVKIDPNFAEAHYNIALSDDSQGKHKEATEEFKTAKKLAPNNKAIVDSEILKKHLR